MAKTVLVIDDEPELVKLLDYNLTRAGYLVLSARDGEKGLAAARQHRPDLIVLDVMMPDLDGWEVCKRLRGEPSTASIPLIMLTAKGQETDRVLGLELGADDYVTKPFSVQELLARVKALLRRAEGPAGGKEVLKVGKLVMDLGRRAVEVGGKKLDLTATEFNLLKALAERAGRVFSRDDLIALARGEDAAVVDRTIDVHIASLRRKLGKHSEMIETVWGVGYRLRE